MNTHACVDENICLKLTESALDVSLWIILQPAVFSLDTMLKTQKRESSNCII